MNSNSEKKTIAYTTGHSSNSAGFSLVELLVVIAILAILVGGVATGVSLLSSGDAKKASKTIESALQETRVSTLSKTGNWKAKIYNEDGTVKIDVINVVDSTENVYSSTKLGSRIQVSYEDGETKTELNAGDAIEIIYSVGSGKFNSINNTKNGQSLKNSIKGEIHIKGQGSSSEYILQLWYETGRIDAGE